MLEEYQEKIREKKTTSKYFPKTTQTKDYSESITKIAVDFNRGLTDATKHIKRHTIKIGK